MMSPKIIWITLIVSGMNTIYLPSVLVSLSSDINANIPKRIVKSRIQVNIPAKTFNMIYKFWLNLIFGMIDSIT